ncbi:MAG: UDP-2,3-diacylglucosamine diphosphatase [Gammaproteobacteria bacterium]
MATLFVSDLHLSAERPDKLELFERFVERARSAAEAVYILGDLFEVWLGDDDETPPHDAVLDALRALCDAGVEVHVAHGNRDFLFGRRFEQRTGARLLPDYAVVELNGERTLLTHGDLLCTRDVKYQRFRRVVRNPLVRRAFLATPLAWRQRIARRTQSGTRASMARKAEHIMDVEQSTVAAVMARHDASLLIHGHTHRPAMHEFEHDGRRRRRIVLGDWYEDDSVLVCDAAGERASSVREYLAASG